MKSILIFDTPTRCYDCPLYTSIDEGEYGFCDDRNILNQKEAQEKIRFNKKPEWCPIKDLPRRMPMRDESEFYLGYMNGKTKYLGFNEGYNACLEDITGDIE